MMSDLSRLPRLGLAVLLGASPGCINLSSQFGTPISEQRVLEIEDGKTTRDQVREWFGPPSAFFRPSLLDIIFEDEQDILARGAPLSEDIYSWRFIESETRIVFLPILFAKMDIDNRATTLAVFFDDNGVVRYHAFRKDES